MTPNMKCKKCGAELHPEQKACLVCGTETELWPGRPTEEQKPPIEIPWTPVAIIAGGLLVVIILIAISMRVRVVPPDEVTGKWLEALLARRFEKAQQYTTPDFESGLADRAMSAEKADEYQLFIYNNDADYTISKPQYNPPKNATSALVTVTFTGKNGQILTQQVQLIRQKAEWKITAVDDGS